MKYLIEQVNIGETKTWSKGGKSGTYTNVGLKIKGKWYNNGVFDEKFLETLKTSEGAEIDLMLFQEEYKEKMYDKFKKSNDIDIIKAEINKLWIEIKELKNK